MTIYIKNMICVRCKMAVQAVLESLGIQYQAINLGKVKLASELTSNQLRELNASLNHYELQLMDDKRKILAERIKVLIIEIFHSASPRTQLKFSGYLSKSLNYDYTYLSNIFTEVEGTTIERFYIENRIERVKELIMYEELTITEIAYQLNYSSVSHLCLQFKKVTGYTPSTFRKLCESDEYIWKKT